MQGGKRCHVASLEDRVRGWRKRALSVELPMKHGEDARPIRRGSGMIMNVAVGQRVAVACAGVELRLESQIPIGAQAVLDLADNLRRRAAVELGEAAIDFAAHA